MTATRAARSGVLALVVGVLALGTACRSAPRSPEEDRAEQHRVVTAYLAAVSRGDRATALEFVLPNTRSATPDDIDSVITQLRGRDATTATVTFDEPYGPDFPHVKVAFPPPSPVTYLLHMSQYRDRWYLTSSGRPVT